MHPHSPCAASHSRRWVIWCWRKRCCGALPAPSVHVKLWRVHAVWWRKRKWHSPRDLQWSAKALSSARAVLEAHRDIVNARHAQLLEIRRLSLIGRLAEAERELKQLDPSSLPPTLRAIHALALAGIALRRL